MDPRSGFGTPGASQDEGELVSRFRRRGEGAGLLELGLTREAGTFATPFETSSATTAKRARLGRRVEHGPPGFRLRVWQERLSSCELEISVCGATPAPFPIHPGQSIVRRALGKVGFSSLDSLNCWCMVSPSILAEQLFRFRLRSCGAHVSDILQHRLIGHWPQLRAPGSARIRKETLMNTGTVKWFNTQKGFGFIQPSNGSNDVFVHISAVERAGMGTLSEGQTLSYDVVADRRTGKSAAENLRAA